MNCIFVERGNVSETIKVVGVHKLKELPKIECTFPRYIVVDIDPVVIRINIGQSLAKTWWVVLTEQEKASKKVTGVEDSSSDHVRHGEYVVASIDANVHFFGRPKLTHPGHMVVRVHICSRQHNIVEEGWGGTKHISSFLEVLVDSLTIFNW
jgi:hypothetical protein